MPSILDPNPLTCIEELWEGLPLLVSKHVGNYTEVVKEGVNGFVFNYKNKEELYRNLDIFLDWNNIEYQKAKEYTIEKMVNYHINFLIKKDTLMKKNSLKLMNSFIIYFLFIIYFIYNQNSNLSPKNLINYYVIVTMYIVVGIVFIIVSNKNSIWIFESVSIITAIYFMMFVYYPLKDINENNTLFFGMQTTNGVIKATAIVAFSYLGYLLGYYWNKKNHFKEINQEYIETHDTKRMLLYAKIMWAIGFFSNLIYVMSSGKNLAYIFSLGQSGNINEELATSSPMGFIGMFGFLMIGSWFYIKEFENKKIIIFITYFLTLLLFLIRGFRFVIVIILVAPLILHYVKLNKKPNFTMIVLVSLCLILMVSVVGLMRNDVRNGTNDANISDLNSTLIEQSLYDNFGQYKTFYIMVDKIPQNYPYTYGVKTFINPIIMFIPRIIWKDKTFLGEYSNNYLNQKARIAGSATPNIGELYMDFGSIGTVLFMFVFGKICSYTKKWYLGKKISIHGLIAYSIVVPLIMQLVIRGYMASNFNLVLFSLLPVIVCKYNFKLNFS